MPQVAHNHLVVNFFFLLHKKMSFNFQTYPQIVRHYRCSHSFVYAQAFPTQAFPTLVQAPCSTSTQSSQDHLGMYLLVFLHVNPVTARGWAM